jgi:CBS domain-containing protein
MKMMLALQKPCLMLTAETAEDVMSPNPVSLRADATIREAIALFTDRGFGAAPVIDDAGRPLGVVSQTDILLHDREQTRQAFTAAESGWDEFPAPSRHEGFSVEVVDSTPVRDLMTPTVFTVDLHTPVERVVEQFQTLKVHHLFVVDEGLSLVGVISALDVLKHLQPA